MVRGREKPREARAREPTNELRQTRFRVSSREARQSAAAGHHRTHTITEKCNVGDHRPLVDCGSRQITLTERQVRGEATPGPDGRSAATASPNLALARCQERGPGTYPHMLSAGWELKTYNNGRI